MTQTFLVVTYNDTAIWKLNGQFLLKNKHMIIRNIKQFPQSHSGNEEGVTEHSYLWTSKLSLVLVILHASSTMERVERKGSNS